MKRLGRMVAICTFAVAALIGGSIPASAASTSWVYLVFPGWLGNCPSSSVYGVQASVGSLWSTNWDLGDDIVYGKVYVGTGQSLSYNLMCRKYGRVVGYQPGSVTIRPPAGTRTIFAGPAGVRYQNH